MFIVNDLRALSKPQRSAFFASLLGWTLDAFDFFILTFIVKDIAEAFSTPGHKVEVSAVSLGIALTLMMRPLGAFLFGWLADRFGRRPVLMADVLLYAGFAFASAFAPNLATLLILRMLFGVAWVGSGVSGRRWPWSRSRPRAAAWSRACFRPAIPLGSCWPRC